MANMVSFALQEVHQWFRVMPSGMVYGYSGFVTAYNMFPNTGIQQLKIIGVVFNVQELCLFPVGLRAVQRCPRHDGHPMFPAMNIDTYIYLIMIVHLFLLL